MTYVIKSEPFQGQAILIPSTIEEIRPLLSTIFSFYSLLLMTRGISEEIELEHPHIQAISEVLSSVVEMNSTNIWAIRTQIQQIHRNYVSLAMEDAFRYTLLEDIFVYPDTDTLDLKWGGIEKLPIRDEYWNLKFPYFNAVKSPMLPDLKLSIFFNIQSDTIHEYAIGFLRELEYQENLAGGNLTEILDEIILTVNENIRDYSD